MTGPRTKFKIALTALWSSFVLVLVRAVLMQQGWDLPDGWVGLVASVLGLYAAGNVGATWAHGRNEDGGGNA